MPATHTLRPEQLWPLQRLALRAALRSPTHCLVRTRRGYSADPGPVTTSGERAVVHFTVRVMNACERDGLVAFDSPQSPTRATLTPAGEAMAEQLVAADAAKAGAA